MSNDPVPDVDAGACEDTGLTGATGGRVQRRRAQREADIIAAVRELIDARGTRDLRIGDIAAAAAVNRAILYRHFTGQQEIYALTAVSHLQELRVDLVAARAGAPDPEAAVVALTEAFMDFGLARPGFVDVASTLLGRSRDELFAEMTPDSLHRLGSAMSDCLVEMAEVLDEGTRTGLFGVQESYLLANTLYAMGLGALQLARVGVSVQQTSAETVRVGEFTAQHVRRTMVTTALSLARG